MNKIEVGFLSGTIGLILGALGTYIFVKKKYEDKYYEELHKAIDEECERLRKGHSEIMSEEDSYDRKSNPEIVLKNTEPDISPTVETQDTPYLTMLKRVEDHLAETQSPPDDDPDNMPPIVPHFIDEDEFRFLPPKYEIRELQYLKKDGTVLDVNDEIVEEPGIYISGLEDELKKMGHYEAAYILVERIGVAVEIVVLEDGYGDLFDTNEGG